MVPQNKNEAKGTIWNWNMKDNAMVRYSHNSTFFGGGSLEQHEEFQITVSLWVKFSEHVVKFFFKNVKKIVKKFFFMEFLKLSYIDFDIYLFIFFPINQ